MSLNKSILVLIAFAASCFLWSCQNKPAPINPNGESELALYMRSMYDESMDIKLALETGDKNVYDYQLDKLLHAEPTPNMDYDTSIYNPHAKAFIENMKMYNQGDLHDAIDDHNVLVSNCMDCHRKLCPGPMVRIKKLYIK